MGCYYTLSGKIAVDETRPGFDEALDKFTDDEGELYSEDQEDCAILDISQEAPFVYFHVFGGMSYTATADWEKAVEEFASLYATKPAILETMVHDGDGPSQLFVGPAGYDKFQAFIDDATRQIFELRRRIDKWEAQRCLRDGS